MDITIQQGKPAEWAEILRVTNAGFGRTGKNWFPINYPHAYPGKAAAKNFTLARSADSGDILGLINYTPLTLKVGNTRIYAAGIGGVCTLPAARGQGVMSKMIRDGNARQAARGVPLGILWGARERYRRYGYECAGEWSTITLDAASLPAAPLTPLRKLTPADTAAALRLAKHDLRSVHRSLAWQRLLLSRKNYTSVTHLSGHVRAYLVTGANNPENIIEAVGDTDMLKSLLCSHCKKHKLTELRMPLLRHTDLGCELALAVSGWQLASTDAGHLAIYDFGMFLQAMATALGERFRAFGVTTPVRLQHTGEQAAFDLIPKKRGAVAVKVASGRGKIALALTAVEWVRTFFPPPAGSLLPVRANPQLLAALQFPLEFPMWDHV